MTESSAWRAITPLLCCLLSAPSHGATRDTPCHVLTLTLFASVASLWARMPRATTGVESVTTMLDVAIVRARVRVRWGFASLWVVVAFLAFFALMAFVWAAATAYPAETVRRMLLAFGIWTAWTGLCQAFALVYYVRRSRELARLEEIKRALADA